MSGKISELLAAKKAANAKQAPVSFEYYPPRTEDGKNNLLKRARDMKDMGPVFMDVTWGAGGSTSDLTLELCQTINNDISVPANMHLTCTNMEKEKIDVALAGAKKAGIQNIVALRGDAPEGQAEWSAVEGGFTCALDLVKYIREQYGDYFCISVSGYPEGHPKVITEVTDASTLSESEKKRVVTLEEGTFVCRDEDYKKEMEYLKAKVDAGANLIITQMVFDAEVFAAFTKECREIGITVPILPGIMCVGNYNGFKKMTNFCKSRYPASLLTDLDAVKDDAEKVRQVGIDFGAKLCQSLVDGGAYSLHFYTLNLSKVTTGILEKLGLLPAQEQEQAVAAV